jgi:hypothetical protein
LNTCLYRAQKLVPRRLSLDRFQYTLKNLWKSSALLQMFSNWLTGTWLNLLAGIKLFLWGRKNCSVFRASTKPGNKYSYSSGSANKFAALLLTLPKFSLHYCTTLHKKHKKENINFDVNYQNKSFLSSQWNHKQTNYA